MPTKEEIEAAAQAAREKESDIMSLVKNIVAEEKTAWREEIRAELGTLKAPIAKVDDEGRVADYGPGDVRIFCASPTERLYSRMPEEVRQWRNPDSDHWGAEFLRGQWKNNPGKIALAMDKLDALFPRTALAEGAGAPTTGAFAAGSGEILPRPLEAIVLIARDRVSKMRRWAQLFTMTTQVHTVPTAASMTAFMTAEGATATDGNPAIASVGLNAQKGQVTALASVEIMRDTAVNLINLWATRGGAALGVLEDDQFFKEGDGSPPNISAFLAGTGYSEKTTTEFKFYDTNLMYFTLGQQYRQNAVWLMDSATLRLFAQLQDSTGDKQFYMGLTDLPGPFTDDPSAEGTIYRRPVYEVPFTAGTVWFGDPTQAYIIGTVDGMVSAVSDQVKFAEDQVMWKLTQRFDGNNIDAAASQVATGIVSVTSVIV